MVNRSEASHEIVQLVPAVAINLRLATLFDLVTVDLTANQILTLLLVKSAEGGRMKSGEIASRLGISLPAATALVDRLVASGVVARSQGEDRRVVWIAVTEECAALLTRLGEGLEKKCRDTLGPIEVNFVICAKPLDPEAGHPRPQTQTP